MPAQYAKHILGKHYSVWFISFAYIWF